MDFSLLQTESRHIGLRDIIALNSRWPYYGIMVLDPIIRFAWIFYAIFTYDAQHSTLVSFLVSLFEVIRRGLWAIFRVENEHCANVSQYKASRDVPLPYRIEPLMDRASAETSPTNTTAEQAQTPGKPPNRASTLRKTPQEQQQQQQPQREEEGNLTASSTAVANSLGTLRRRPGVFSSWSLSKVLAEAHKQDFEKKRKKVEVGTGGEEGNMGDDYDDDDDEDDDEDDVDRTNTMDTNEAANLAASGSSGRGASGFL